MKRNILLPVFFFMLLGSAAAQVKIGYNASSAVDSAAILELSNDLGSTSGNWKTLLLPQVSFSNVAIFIDSSAWGIAGTATEGAVVYNNNNRIDRGFKGKGAYVWMNNAWVLMRNIEYIINAPFALTNCGSPTISGLIVNGTATSATVTLNYINGDGSARTAFTSSTVSGVTLNASAGTFANGSGSVTYTASGTPTTTGSISIPVTLKGVPCNIPLTISAAAFSFTNCSSPTISGTFSAGNTATGTVTLNYANGNGSSYSAFTSSTVNGMTLSAPAGTLASGTGSIVFTVSGTPTASGNFSIPVTILSASCSVPVTVTTSVCSDPGSTVGNTGCVVFTYKGQSTQYTTVRAADNHIWLQQNLGSTRVATSASDANAFGDYFQWGRWDDGHQTFTSTASASTASPNNPLGLGGGSGSANYYPNWWTGGLSTDTWSGTTASATNGKDPCAAIGTGWHVPTHAEWNTMKTAETITNMATAYSSRLKIPGGGYKDMSGASTLYGTNTAWYWTGTAGGTGFADDLNFYGSGVNYATEDRGYGESCRCMK